jgi:hypothetical protein
MKMTNVRNANNVVADSTKRPILSIYRYVKRYL